MTIIMNGTFVYRRAEGDNTMFRDAIFKRGTRAVAATALAVLGMLALAAPAPAQTTDVTVTPAALDFGLVVVGDTSPEQILTFSNETGANTELFPVVTESTGPGIFDFGDTQDCVDENTSNVTVPAFGSCELGIVFQPADVGVSTTIVEWATDVFGEEVVAATELSGEGVDALPPPTTSCEPPAGPVSGPLHTLGEQLGPLGASLVNLAQELCAAGL